MLVKWSSRILWSLLNNTSDLGYAKDPDFIGTINYIHQEFKKHKIRHWTLNTGEIGLFSKGCCVHMISAKIHESEWVLTHQYGPLNADDKPKVEHIKLTDPEAITKLCQRLPKHDLLKHWISCGIVFMALLIITFYQVYCKLRGLEGI